MQSSDTKKITSAQVRAGRALLGLTAAQLAETAQVGVATIRRFESQDAYAPTAANLSAIRTALEAAGVIFIDQNGEGPGVRLKKQP